MRLLGLPPLILQKLLEESKKETKFFTTALLLGKKISCRTSEKNKKGTGYFLNQRELKGGLDKSSPYKIIKKAGLMNQTLTISMNK